MGVGKRKGPTSKFNWKTAGLIGLAALVLCGLFLPGGLLNNSAGAGGSGSLSTFRTISYTDGEDVSNFQELSIWTWDPDKNYDEPEDLRRLSNFEETVTSADADDIEIDLTDYDYGVWIEVDPDAETVFSNNYIWLSTAMNVAEYPIYVFHQASDVDFNILDGAMVNWAADEVTDDNWTIFYDFPERTTTNVHADSSDWEVDEDTWEDFTEDEIAYYQDEANFRAWAPLYSPANDTDKDYSTVFERYTWVPAFKFTMNTTISTTDAAITQVNCTIAEEYAEYVTVQIDGTYMWFLISRPITAPGEIMFEIDFASDIKCSSVHSTFAAVVGDESSVTLGVALSARAT